MSDLIEHDCPVEGHMMIEKDRPCNWCDDVPELAGAVNNDARKARET